MKLRPHINLEVRDLAQSIAFYTEMLGMAPTKRKPDYTNFRHEALHLALVAKPQKTARPLDDGQHFGFELFDHADLTNWKHRLKDAGLLPTLEEANVTCCYAVADKFWLTDPDGNQWEFWVKTDEDGQTLASSNAFQASCCA